MPQDISYIGWSAPFFPFCDVNYQLLEVGVSTDTLMSPNMLWGFPSSVGETKPDPKLEKLMMLAYDDLHLIIQWAQRVPGMNSLALAFFLGKAFDHWSRLTFRSVPHKEG